MLHTLSDEVLHAVMAYDWPGNVRELENMIERACAMASGEVVHVGDLPTPLQEVSAQLRARAVPESVEAASVGAARA